MGSALQGRFLELALKRSVPIWLDSPVKRLVVENGRVAGVVVVRDGREVTVRSRRGVLINAGGFSHNREMRGEHQPSARPNLSLANRGDTGEMLEEAIRVGATTANMDLSWWVPMSLRADGMPLMHTSDIGKPHALVVDQEGKRFVCEPTSYVEFGIRYFEREAKDPSRPLWFLFDHNYVAKYRFGGIDAQPLASRFGLSRQDDNFPAEWITGGYLKRAVTLEGLAASCDLPLDTLRDTVERFNRFGLQGTDDDFGRGKSAYHQWNGDPRQRPNTNLGALESAPFYAVRIIPGDVGTAGGLVTDCHSRVLDRDGMVISGLYATGNSTAPVVGASYPGAGASIAASLVFGVLAARHAMGSNMQSDSAHAPLDAATI